MALYFPGEASIIEFYDPVMGANQPPPNLCVCQQIGFLWGFFCCFFPALLTLLTAHVTD